MTVAVISWKGTDVCLSLTCECGEQAHVDGYFVYHLRCAECGAVWQMPWEIPVKRVEPADDDLVAQDHSEALVVNGQVTGYTVGDGDGKPWREVKKVPTFREAREAEQG